MSYPIIVIEYHGRIAAHWGFRTVGDNGTRNGTLDQPVLGFLNDETPLGGILSINIMMAWRADVRTRTWCCRRASGVESRWTRLRPHNRRPVTCSRHDVMSLLNFNKTKS